MARPAKVTRKKLSALVVNPEQFKAILKTDGLKRIYFEITTRSNTRISPQPKGK